MVRAAGSVRDRALLWTMMEGAFRPGEILNMRIGGVEFADHYMMVSTSGKTGQKNLALVLSLQPMIEWFRLHPHADDPAPPRGSPRWPGTTGWPSHARGWQRWSERRPSGRASKNPYGTIY